MELNKIKFAIIAGIFTGCGHLLWSILVALGWAQPILNWIFWLHFLSNPYLVGSFELPRALLLVGFTTLTGFCFGWCLAWMLKFGSSRA